VALQAAGKARVLLAACMTSDAGAPPDWAAGDDRPGVNLITPSDEAADLIAHDFAAIRRPGDVAIVSIHWGRNWGYSVGEAQRAFARSLIRRAGVSVVHGHSSHHPKGLEVFEDGLILYGCGDFLNDYEGIGGYEAFRSDLVAAYLASVDPANGRLRALEILPFQIRRFRLQRPSGGDLAWFGARLDRESAQFGTRIDLAPDGRLFVRLRDVAD
jgi:poly-gamma-glutamate synthesis protein (capsule biosynthesis protein)